LKNPLDHHGYSRGRRCVKNLAGAFLFLGLARAGVLELMQICIKTKFYEELKARRLERLGFCWYRTVVRHKYKSLLVE
jgi:hypothetical protein